MKFQTLTLASLAASLTVAQAQTAPLASDVSLINIQTPTLLHSGQSSALVDLRYFGGYDKTLHGDLEFGYGISKHFELDVAGSFAKWNSAATPSGNVIRFGGTDEELSLRYHVPGMGSLPVAVQVGLADTQTPAQDHKLAATLGGSVGYSLDRMVRFYFNPKAVFLDHNTLVGLGLGASVELVSKVSFIADWTPMVAGDNTIDTQTGNRSRGQIYSAGLRYSGSHHKNVLDLGVTNGTGITTGSSLTPSLGNSPALFVRLTHRF